MSKAVNCIENYKNIRNKKYNNIIFLQYKFEVFKTKN